VSVRDKYLFRATEELEQDAIKGGGMFDVQPVCAAADDY
jgi:hypothetical protein